LHGNSFNVVSISRDTFFAGVREAFGSVPGNLALTSSALANQSLQQEAVGLWQIWRVWRRLQIRHIVLDNVLFDQQRPFSCRRNYPVCFAPILPDVSSSLHL
jgi:hypothetical protein